jgi:hypothetical protein
MLLTLSTDTAVHIGAVGAVLEVVSAGCRQGGIERRRPLFVSLCQPQTRLGVRLRSRSTWRKDFRS